jgi:excisionase family DNA binding protein
MIIFWSRLHNEQLKRDTMSHNVTHSWTLCYKNAMDTYYTPLEVAELLKCSRAYVYQLVARGRLQGINIGTTGQHRASIRITKTSVDQFVSKATI